MNLKWVAFCKSIRLILAGAALVALGGCTTGSRLETADRIAGATAMQRTTIDAAPFVLTAFEKAIRQDQPATLYIEGDGLAWISRRTPSLDPTPRHPVALELAARDDSPNVIYLARPCQYSKMLAGRPCPLEYWTSHRFAPDVINAMDAALDSLKQRHRLTGFNLVGYSGGGAVAVLLASRRNDILSLRTVAGNLDNAAMTAIHDISPMTGSLDPADVARTIAFIPQHHFIGARDTVIPAQIFQSYRAASGESACIRSSLIAGADHRQGWAERWPDLLRAPLDCAAGSP